MTTHAPRRRLVTVAATAAAAALALAGCTTSAEGGGSEGGSDGGEVRTINVSAPPSYNQLPIRVAEEEGFFEEVGIEVEMSTVVGGEAVPALAGGNLDFILNDMVTLSTARAQGLPLVIAAPSVLLDEAGTERAYAEILIRAEDEGEYERAADIAGHAFGVPTVNSEPWLDARSLVEEAGGDPDAIEFVQVPDPLQALREGTVDFVTAPNPAATAAMAADDLTSFVPLTSESLGGMVGYPYLTTEQLVAEDPELFEDFQTAFLKASVFINENPDRAKEIAGTFLDFPEEVLAESTLPVFGEEMPTADELDQVIARIVDNGILESGEAPAGEDLLP